MQYHVIIVNEKLNGDISLVSYGGVGNPENTLITDYHFKEGDRLEWTINRLRSHYVVVDVIWKREEIDLYIKNDFHSIKSKRRSCRGCGTTNTIKEIQKKFPMAESCCESRDMTGPIKVHEP